MKISDLTPGMTVAVKAGPSSKSLDRGVVLSSHPAEKYGRRGIPIAFAKAPDKVDLTRVAASLEARGLDPTTAGKLAREMTRQWDWETRSASLIVESWESYRLRVDAARSLTVKARSEAEARWEAAVIEAKALSIKLGVQITVQSRSDPDFQCSVSLTDLRKLAERLTAAVKVKRVRPVCACVPGFHGDALCPVHRPENM